MIGLYVIMISLITEERMRICKLYIQFWIIVKNQTFAEDNRN